MTFRPRYNKFSNQKTAVDNILFDSKAEAERYSELKLLLRAGAIRDLERQVKYDLVVHGVKVCAYVADFRYVELDPGWRGLVVEDVKGFRTPEYIIKRKLMLAVYGIEIVEIGGAKKCRKQSRKSPPKLSKSKRNSAK